MNNLFKLEKNMPHCYRIVKYVLCSVATALLETAVGWVLLHLLPYGIVAANTVAIIIGAIVHYFLTLLLVFEKRKNAKSFAVYIVTFLLGLVLQNAIIWAFYEQLLINQTEIFRFVISKGMSLVIPFFLLYYIRSYFNQKIKGYNLK